MPRMKNIEGLAKLQREITKRIVLSKKDDDVDVIVGYTAAYAVHVHENLEAKHNKGQQAKFLEQPARQNRTEYAAIIKTAARKTKTLVKGLLLAGLRLQRDSQQLVPVDTGNLKGSAFTILDKDRSGFFKSADKALGQ